MQCQLLRESLHSSWLRELRARSPIAIAISVIIAGEIFSSSRAIRQYFEWLVNTTEKIVRVVRTDLNKRIDVLFHTCWRQAPHEIEHRVHWISHAGEKDDALTGSSGFTKSPRRVHSSQIEQGLRHYSKSTRSGALACQLPSVVRHRGLDIRYT